MFARRSLLPCAVTLALWAVGVPLVQARSFVADGAAGPGGVGPVRAYVPEIHAAPVPEPTAAALLAIGGGLALMAALRRPPQE